MKNTSTTDTPGPMFFAPAAPPPNTLTDRGSLARSFIGFVLLAFSPIVVFLLHAEATSPKNPADAGELVVPLVLTLAAATLGLWLLTASRDVHVKQDGAVITTRWFGPWAHWTHRYEPGAIIEARVEARDLPRIRDIRAAAIQAAAPDWVLKLHGPDGVTYDLGNYYTPAGAVADAKVLCVGTPIRIKDRDGNPVQGS